MTDAEDLTLELRHSRYGTVLEFDLEKLTDARGRFVFLDGVGEGRLMVSADELDELQQAIDGRPMG